MSEIAEKPRSRTREIARAFWHHEVAPLLIVMIALIFVMGAATRGLTLSRANAFNVLLQSSIRGISAIGQAFVILTAGIDVSVGGNALFCSVLGAGLMAENWQNIILRLHLENVIAQPFPLAVGAFVMVLAGLGWGAFNGVFVSKVGIPALIVTLGLWQILDGLAFRVSEGRAVGWQPEGIIWWGAGTVAGVPVPVIIFIVVAIIAYFVLTYTTYGRSVYAVGGNPVSAWLAGIKVNRILFTVYCIAGFLSGLAAFIMLGRIQSASMRSLGGLEIDSIAAATIGGISLMGGRGSILGVIIGAIIIGTVNNGMSVLNADPSVYGIVKGSIIIIAVTIDYVRRRRA
jgi:inositol transport system permease protein